MLSFFFQDIESLKIPTLARDKKIPQISPRDFLLFEVLNIEVEPKRLWSRNLYSPNF